MTTYERVQEIQEKANIETKQFLKQKAIEIVVKEFGCESVRAMLDDNKKKVIVNNKEYVLSIAYNSFRDFQVKINDHKFVFDFFESTPKEAFKMVEDETTNRV